MSQDKYVVRVDNNSRGWVEFPDLCVALEYARNVSRLYPPYDATVNDNKGIVAHYLLGVRY